MPLWLWIVIGFIAAVNLGAAVAVVVGEVNDWHRSRQRERAFAESVIAWAQREEAMRYLRRVPSSDRWAA